LPKVVDKEHDAHLFPVGTLNFLWGFTIFAMTLKRNNITINTMKNFKIKNGVAIIPEGTTEIEERAFAHCSKLVSITIPSSVKRIGEAAFLGCDNLTHVVVSQGVKEIGAYAFKECTALADVTIHEGVEEIGTMAFYYCKSLTTITMPSTMKRLGEWVFSDCYSLTSIVVPEGVETLPLNTFRSCYSLTHVTLPSSLKEIGVLAFYECEKLTLINIPEGLTKIECEAFEGCSALTNITLPSSLTEIGEKAFKGCSGITGTMVIPGSIKVINSETFEGCSGLTSLVIQSGVTSIGDMAFWGCANLTSITIPDSVTSIESVAFVGCTNLTSITIPDSVTTIGDGIFAACTSLTSITLPDSIKALGEDILYDTTTDRLTKRVEKIRKGDTSSARETVRELFNEKYYCKTLLQPADKHWLLALNMYEADYIVLGGFYEHQTKEVNRIWFDEAGNCFNYTGEASTGEMWFESTEEEAKALYDKTCQSPIPNDDIKVVHEWLRFTPFDYLYFILHRVAEMDAQLSSLTTDDCKLYGWMCEELGDTYYFGCERFGYYADIDKARTYYAKAQQAKDITGDEDILSNGNPLDDYDEDDYEDMPDTYKHYVSGPAEELAKVKAFIDELTVKYGMPDNEFGRYVPNHDMLRTLLGVDTKYPDYRGNLLRMDEQPDGTLVLTVEGNQGFVWPCALEQGFPAIKVEDAEKEPDTTTFKYHITGSAKELAQVKAFVDDLFESHSRTDDEQQRYVPKPLLISLLTGLKADEPQYDGKLLRMEESTDGIILYVEAEGEYPMEDSLRYKFPKVKVRVIW
jgi:hypothetical protein